jgi:hypothetical protein
MCVFALSSVGFDCIILFCNRIRLLLKKNEYLCFVLILVAFAILHSENIKSGTKSTIVKKTERT